eukprot:1351020-Prymnesium_polylepis.1
MASKPTQPTAVDFIDEERVFLSDELAQQALARAGIQLEELRPSAAGADKAHAEHKEKRRQYKWTLVRDELAKLKGTRQQAAAREAERQQAASAGGPGSAHAQLNAAVRRELAAAGTALQREWEVESR